MEEKAGATYGVPPKSPHKLPPKLGSTEWLEHLEISEK